MQVNPLPNKRGLHKVESSLLFTFMRCSILAGLALVLTMLLRCSVLGATVPETRLEVNVKYGTHERHALDIYTPVAEDQPPVLVFFHGGGWMMGDKKTFAGLAKRLAKAGYVVVLPNYRLHPEVVFPAFVEDGAAAVKWVQDNIAKHGGDPERIFLGGHSAGAHTAALLALDETYLEAHGLKLADLTGVIGFAGPYAMPPSISGQFAKPFRGTPDKQTMPINYVDGPDEGEPPFLLIHGRADRLCPHFFSVMLSSAIATKGGTCKPLILDGHNHMTVVGTDQKNHPIDEIEKAVMDFLKAKSSVK